MDTTSTTVQETKVVQATPTGQVETHTVRSSSPIGDFFVNKTNQVLVAIVTIIDILIALRFMFLLLGANQVGVVNFILVVTNVFVAPFSGIFPSPSAGGAYFEIASILAIIIWAIFAIILGIVINLFSVKKTDI